LDVSWNACRLQASAEQMRFFGFAECSDRYHEVRRSA
jgi:hypothetical protein